MTKTLPDPAEYMEDILESVKYNITTDKANLTRELTNKVLGFQIGSFGRIEISDSKVNEIKRRIGPEILQNAEDKLVRLIEENLDRTITKALVNEMTKEVIDKIYNDVADRIFTVISERISERVDEKINETLKTWMVAAKFVK